MIFFICNPAQRRNALIKILIAYLAGILVLASATRLILGKAVGGIYDASDVTYRAKPLSIEGLGIHPLKASADPSTLIVASQANYDQIEGSIYPSYLYALADDLSALRLTAIIYEIAGLVGVDWEIASLQLHLPVFSRNRGKIDVQIDEVDYSAVGDDILVRTFSKDKALTFTLVPSADYSSGATSAVLRVIAINVDFVRAIIVLSVFTLILLSAWIIACHLLCSYRTSRGKCINCAYPLAKGSSTCPECGYRVSTDTRSR